MESGYTPRREPAGPHDEATDEELVELLLEATGGPVTGMRTSHPQAQAIVRDARARLAAEQARRAALPWWRRLRRR